MADPAPPAIAKRPIAERSIAERASFEHIRYAQLWEDADILVAAMPQRPGAGAPGATLVSICSAGDNALALLTLDPARVVAVDISRVQLDCLRIRIAAYREFTHAEFLELMGSRPSTRRRELLARVLPRLDETTRAFWTAQTGAIIAHGLGGVGKFERYFRILATWLLPLVHSRKTRDDLFVSRPPAERARFFEERWNNRRWRILLQLFFSRFTMGRLGRDPAFFAEVEGSVAAHVDRRVRHAAVANDPAQNPYLHWIIKGTHGAALPLAWRAETYDLIRSRLDRLVLHEGPIETALAAGEKADGFNLSDIFEYMDVPTFETVYRSILGLARPAARLVYWNMMVPRRVPPPLAFQVTRLKEVEDRLKPGDKAFFYSDFVVEEVVR